MSRNNKVNPDHYTMAGRLSADELARQRVRQGEQQPGGRRRRGNKPVPPWMAHEQVKSGNETPDSTTANAEASAEGETGESAVSDVDTPATEVMAKPVRQATPTRPATASRKQSRPAGRPKTTKRAAAKKTGPKKTGAKKGGAKKAGAKKAGAKKAVARKSVAKKTVAKKTRTNKTATKRTAKPARAAAKRK